VLFRSAAVAYKERVIGIVLTGLLNDGTAGMLAIKHCGGMAIVQDPTEAEYPEMPLAVLDQVAVDHSLPVAQMGFVIHDHIRNAKPELGVVPPEIITEARIAEKVSTNMDDVQRIGAHSLYACPDCGGGLWEINENGFRRYRCHIGHSYSELDLLKKQSESIEASLWIALRIMEERRHLLARIAKVEQEKGLLRLASDHERRAQALQPHIDSLKQLLNATRQV
jgi:two-component system chemotaxis response regulator CheB